MRLVSGSGAAVRTLQAGDSAGVDVPASSANLGSGFDCVGLGLELRDRYAVTVTDRPGLVVELAGMKPDAERFTAKTTVLIENVRHHIEEEEEEWFPKVREGLGRKVLQEIGAEMKEARKTAPTRPSQPSALKKTIDAVIA